MSIEPNLFRIKPDADMPGKWAFVDNRSGLTVGGFSTAKDARRAYERTRKVSK